MNDPAEFTHGEGMKAADYLSGLLDEYYETRGWDQATSLPTREKLLSLDLADVADVLDKEHAVV